MLVGVGVGAGVLSVDEVDPFVDTVSITGATSVTEHINGQGTISSILMYISKRCNTATDIIKKRNV